MNFMGYLLVGIAIGIVFDRYVFPIFDVLLELFNLKMSERGTEIQLNTQAMGHEFIKIYGDKEELQPAIGFSMDNTEEVEIDEDECEDINKNYRTLNHNGKRVVGFSELYCFLRTRQMVGTI